MNRPLSGGRRSGVSVNETKLGYRVHRGGNFGGRTVPTHRGDGRPSRRQNEADAVVDVVRDVFRPRVVGIVFSGLVRVVAGRPRRQDVGDLEGGVLASRQTIVGRQHRRTLRRRPTENRFQQRHFFKTTRTTKTFQLKT